MKKILAVLLAALMMFSTLGMVSFAAGAGVDEFTLNDAFAIAEAYAGTDGQVPTVLIFDTGSVNLGTVPQGMAYKITSGAYTGCYALVTSMAKPGNYIQVPYTSNAGEGQVANWQVLTAFMPTEQYPEEVPAKVIQGDLFRIPKVMETRNQLDNRDNVIVFRAVTTANETTPVINKIMTVFCKVIKVLFGEQLANTFYNVLKELGLEIDLDVQI